MNDRPINFTLLDENQENLRIYIKTQEKKNNQSVLQTLKTLKCFNVSLNPIKTKRKISAQSFNPSNLQLLFVFDQLLLEQMFSDFNL